MLGIIFVRIYKVKRVIRYEKGYLAIAKVRFQIIGTTSILVFFNTKIEDFRLGVTISLIWYLIWFMIIYYWSIKTKEPWLNNKSYWLFAFTTLWIMLSVQFIVINVYVQTWIFYIIIILFHISSSLSTII